MSLYLFCFHPWYAIQEAGYYPAINWSLNKIEKIIIINNLKVSFLVFVRLRIWQKKNYKSYINDFVNKLGLVDCKALWHCKNFCKNVKDRQILESTWKQNITSHVKLVIFFSQNKHSLLVYKEKDYNEEEVGNDTSLVFISPCQTSCCSAQNGSLLIDQNTEDENCKRWPEKDFLRPIWISLIFFNVQPLFFFSFLTIQPGGHSWRSRTDLTFPLLTLVRARHYIMEKQLFLMTKNWKYQPKQGKFSILTKQFRAKRVCSPFDHWQLSCTAPERRVESPGS